jgi:peptide methionine sulfoxide reductase MsrB
MHFQKAGDAELRQVLTPPQYEVTHHDATEPAFRNALGQPPGRYLTYPWTKGAVAAV